MALMSYLSKDRNGVYQFRRVIPAGLRPFMPAQWRGKANWKRTLRTKAPAVAKIEASKALRDCTIAFQSAERAMRGEAVAIASQQAPEALSTVDIENDTIADMLADDDRERDIGDDRKYLQTPDERKQWPDLAPVAFGRKGMAIDHAHVYELHIEGEAVAYREALSRRDPAIVDAELRIYLRNHHRRSLSLSPQ